MEDEEEEEGYRQLEGDLVTVTLHHNNYGLGISLAGHKGTDSLVCVWLV